jgi:dihydrofolate reductase
MGMRKVIAIEHLTLDGVMQSPGHQDEDPRDGFSLGGWAAQRGHPLMQEVMGAHMSDRWALLAGRTTYVRFADYWPKQPPNPFTEALTRVRKYVVSTTLQEPLPWENSVLLRGDATDAVAGLKRDVEENLVVFGSGVLVRSLLRCNLVDELLLLFHPIVLGSGRRLFSEDCQATFEMTESCTTPTGVIVATYRAAGE